MCGSKTTIFTFSVSVEKASIFWSACDRPDVEIQRRGDVEVLDLLLRLVALRVELEADLHRRFRVDT